MATSHYKGSADIEYTPLGGTSTVHDLAIKLLVSRREGFRFRRRARVFSRWKADFTDRETFVIGSKVYEAVFTIRFDDEPDAVRSMLEEALFNDVTLNYRPTGSGGSSYPLRVVSVEGSTEVVELTPDADRGGYGEWQVRFTARRVDGSSLAGLL